MSFSSIRRRVHRGRCFQSPRANGWGEETTGSSGAFCGTSWTWWPITLQLRQRHYRFQSAARVVGCHGVVCCCPVRPTPKGWSDWTDLRDLDLDLD